MTKPKTCWKCAACGLEFPKTADRKRATYCSLQCQILPRLKLRPETGCIEWQGATNSAGYGQIRSGPKALYVHRVMYSLSRQRPINAGAQLLHSCDNPPCCNPAHLREGGYSENQQDALDRGRMPVGLTQDQAREAISLRGNLKQAEIAKRFGVSVNTVHKWQKHYSDGQLAPCIKSRGSEIGTSKLNDDAIRYIRDYVAQHGRGAQAAMAKKYKTHANNINKIVHRQSWQHVPE